jgi:hypothetical protein
MLAMADGKVHILEYQTPFAIQFDALEPNYFFSSFDIFMPHLLSLPAQERAKGKVL